MRLRAPEGGSRFNLNSPLRRINDCGVAFCLFCNRQSRNLFVRSLFRLVSRLGGGIFWYTQGCCFIRVLLSDTFAMPADLAFVAFAQSPDEPENQRGNDERCKLDAPGNYLNILFHFTLLSEQLLKTDFYTLNPDSRILNPAMSSADYAFRSSRRGLWCGGFPV